MIVEACMETSVGPQAEAVKFQVTQGYEILRLTI